MTITLHPRVLEFIASRICHDLVSPVGAISNGVELMQELGEDAGAEAVKLIATSAHQASFRLKAFRLSYGAAGTDKNIGFKDISEAFTDLISASRVKVTFEDGLSAKFSMPPRGFFKCLLNLLILAEECNHGEGSLNVTAIDGNKGIAIQVSGKNPGFREGAADALVGKTDPDDLDPRLVHAYVTGRFAEWFGFKLDWDSEPETGHMSFRLTF
ncbi:MAG: histidine phosphotransferase family protein [Alphaproteobacteria bacterium]|nr:histidine phosphotransferase family protein [Alphaproteobacteria bacterium]